jgi:hypothetical protein
MAENILTTEGVVYTPRQAADFLGVRTHVIYAMRKRGELTGKQFLSTRSDRKGVSGQIFFTQEELLALKGKRNETTKRT